MLHAVFTGLLAILVCSGCGWFNRTADDVVVARAHNSYLYMSDLENLVPAGSSPADSAVLMKRFVDNWVRQQVLLHRAIKDLPAEKMNFERAIQDYKNSLIIFAYETELVKKHLDTSVSEAQIRAYYDEHKSTLTLRENIVKVIYVKLPLDAPELNRVRRLYRSTSDADLDELEAYSLDHAASYFLDIDSWMLFSDILRDAPLNASNPEQWLRNNRHVELRDDFYRHFIHIIEYKLKGDISPLVFERENIRSILLNHRKHTYINEQRNLFFQEALQSGDFEVYY